MRWSGDHKYCIRNTYAHTSNHCWCVLPVSKSYYGLMCICALISLERCSVHVYKKRMVGSLAAVNSQHIHKHGATQTDKKKEILRHLSHHLLYGYTYNGAIMKDEIGVCLFCYVLFLSWKNQRVHAWVAIAGNQKKKKCGRKLKCKQRQWYFRINQVVVLLCFVIALLLTLSSCRCFIVCFTCNYLCWGWRSGSMAVHITFMTRGRYTPQCGPTSAPHKYLITYVFSADRKVGSLSDHQLRTRSAFAYVIRYLWGTLKWARTGACGAALAWK